MTNRPALEASCIHRLCISTCFALPRPLRLTRHIVADASRCRFNPHDIPMSFVMLWIPNPSDAALDSGVQLTISRGQRHDLLFLGPHLEAVSASHDDPSRHGPPGSLVASPVSVRICLQLATLLPTEPAPRSRPPDEVSSDPLDVHVAHGRPRHRTTHLHRSILEIWSILRQSVPVVTFVNVVPVVFSLDVSLSSSVLTLAFILPLRGTRCRGVIRSLQLKTFSLTCLWSASIVMPSRFHAMTRFSILPLFSSAGFSPITCFLMSYLFDIILMRSSTADRSPPTVMSSPCTVATMSSPLMHPRHTHGHAIPRVNLRSLSVDVSSSCQFCAASRVPYKLYCSRPHMCSSPGW